MSIKKYTTFEEAERDLWGISSGKNNLKKVFAVFRVKQFKKAFNCHRGIFKYKSIQEANADAEKWLREPKPWK